MDHTISVTSATGNSVHVAERVIEILNHREEPVITIDLATILDLERRDVLVSLQRNVGPHVSLEFDTPEDAEAFAQEIRLE